MLSIRSSNIRKSLFGSIVFITTVVSSYSAEDLSANYSWLSSLNPLNYFYGTSTTNQCVIGQTLHELSANPVLDGDLVYTDEGKENRFRIRDLINDGCIDLSNPDFGDSSNCLNITTTPDAFFRVVKNSLRLVILIAPKFLIEEKIKIAPNTFQPIMANWIEEQAPIGIFYRMESWTNLAWFDYLTAKNLLQISKTNLYENWLPTGRSGEPTVERVCRGAEAINFMFICNDQGHLVDKSNYTPDKATIS